MERRTNKRNTTFFSKSVLDSVVHDGLLGNAEIEMIWKNVSAKAYKYLILKV